MKREREDVTCGDVATEMMSFEKTLGRKFARLCKESSKKQIEQMNPELFDLMVIGHEYANLYEKSVDFAQDQTNKYNVQETLRGLKIETKNLRERLSRFTPLDEVD